MTTELLTEGNAPDTITVSRVVSQPVKTVWSALFTPDGQTALLGVGASLGDKGDRWQAADGSCGVTRSYHPLEEVRFSWRQDEYALRTMVTMRFIPDGDKTTITITHEHAGANLDREQLTARWQATLDFLANS